MRGECIRIRGARQNNLQGVDVELPRQALVAITGVSGSGKSSLAFDTLFREGQRRFLETLSAYARQFLGGLSKPDVESIEGLSPAIAVDQKTVSRGSRSTVGTVTEIVDYLRVLYARAGEAHCPACDLPVRSRTPEAVVQEVLRETAGERLQLLAPLIRDRKGHHRPLFEDLRKKGFVRVRVDGELVRLEEVPELERYKRHTIEVVVDRLKPSEEDAGRLREAVEQALELGGGDVIALTDSGERRYSTARTCPGCGAETPPLEPRLFSFNSPHGACPTCEGLGEQSAPSEASVVRDRELSIRAGALAVTRKDGGGLLFPRCDWVYLERVAEHVGFDLDTPWKSLGAKARRAVLQGTGEERFADRAAWKGQRSQGEVEWQRRYKGVLPALRAARGKGAWKHVAERFLVSESCEDCGGSRLNVAARAVRLGGVRISQLTSVPVGELCGRLGGIELSARQRRIAQDLLSEIERRAGFLTEVGLGYLTLDRAADSLSGGESQRIRLAAQLGAGLQGVLYVLDEPSIGLHARDHGRLLQALARLRDLGNSVVVVEHDEATLRSADWLVDVGPGAGRHGGRVVASGPPAEVAHADTPTGRLLRGELAFPEPRARPQGERWLRLRGASAFNLKEVDVDLPLGNLVVVSGVSGSGKSTLVERTLQRAILRHLGREVDPPGAFASLAGLEHLDDMIAIDADPIGRTPRSNPATYIKVFDAIRDLFAELPESRLRGYSKSRFSFNVAGGRCESCQGAGARYVELQFLSPVTVPCEECGGHRFQAETLDARYKGHSIADVLALDAETALELFRDHPRIRAPLEWMVSIGLGYLTLGQPSTTLSGGEAQRIKLVTHLAKRARGHVLYLLDEPTTGLHMEDVGRLVGALQKLVDHGHTVLVVEHNLELLRAADYVIDLGPEAGEAGGRVVAHGTPAELARAADSHTGQALRELEDARRRSARGVCLERSGQASRELVVQGARTHNLQGVDVRIPRESLTVVTGPSGSGKSSLALDTIHTEGRRRFVESLSTYARQFLGTRERPPFERIEGLGPSIAVEARTSASHPRSTVATTTEIHDHVRVLWARTGQPHCPTHGTKLEKGDPASAAKRILKKLEGERGWILAPVLTPADGEAARSAKELATRVAAWKKAGYVRVLVDGKEQRLDGELGELAPSSRLDLVIDRVAFEAGARARIAEAVEHAAALTHGRASALVKAGSEAGQRLEFSLRGACTQCGFQLESELEPRHFSFNTHVGACKACEGLGTLMRASAALLVSDPEAPLCEGAIGGKLGRYLTKGKGYYEMLLRTVAREHKIDLERPFSELASEARELLLHGRGAKASYTVQMERQTANAEVHERFVTTWPGLCGHVDAWHQKTDDAGWAAVLQTVMESQVCPDCEGERLDKAYRFVSVGGLRVAQFLRFSVENALAWLAKLSLPTRQLAAVEPVLSELRSRIGLLERVGLGYLTLDRSTATLSGGEARRVRLSASLGSHLVGVCYVLDEPTVGLHPRDIDRLAGTLGELCARGNTVLTVEHDETLVRHADWIVDMGPGAGSQGGRVVASGPLEEILAHPTSKTGAWLRGELALEQLLEDERRSRAPSDLPKAIALRGARAHNLRGVDLDVGFGELLGVCGPSGSGKSTLVLDVLVPALRGEEKAGRWERLAAPLGGGTRVIVVDASPIGRSPHSVPATYTGLMKPLRELFARTPDARVRGFEPARFSFNSNRGRCPACEGKGAVLIEMQFLADLWLTCEECDGKRFLPEVLEVRYRGRSIADVLDMTVDDARAFLEHQPEIERVLAALTSVGLGYLRLGQSSTTLSGGEAQRVKLAAELAGSESASRAVIVLDEPSTGLSASDTVHLARVLLRLARRGNAVILIEHHTELLALCDRLVELGPEGGEGGGRLVASGTPSELAADPTSVTGPWLRGGKARVAEAKRAKRPRKKTKEGAQP